MIIDAYVRQSVLRVDELSVGEVLNGCTWEVKASCERIQCLEGLSTFRLANHSRPTLIYCQYIYVVSSCCQFVVFSGPFISVTYADSFSNIKIFGTLT